jgi:hypothetical protein
MQANVLREIWRITKDIEQAAAVGEWERTASLALERTPLIYQLSASQPAAALEMIRAIQTIDHAVMQQAKTAQQEMGSEYASAMNSVRGASQYQAVAQMRR